MSFAEVDGECFRFSHLHFGVDRVGERGGVYEMGHEGNLKVEVEENRWEAERWVMNF
jgi:hypothetical protein